MWWAAGGVAVGLLLAAHAWRRTQARQEVEVGGRGRVVVVTGCDTGIGHQLALRARAWGWTVVATCLDPGSSGARDLLQAGVLVVGLDLMLPDTFNELLETLQRLKMERKELWCLVNNAAVLTYANCEWQTSEMVASQVGVNLMGLIQLTRALLPILRRNKGRVVTVSSPTGQVATPNMTVYCATKWGVEGFTQALRRELAHTGVSVTLVRPCNLPNRTGILRNNAVQLRKMQECAAKETLQDYGSTMEEAERCFRQAYDNVARVQDLHDDHLLHCFRSAIMSQRPLPTYSAAPLLVRLLLALLQHLPTPWVDYLVARDFYNFVLNLARNT